MVAYCYMKVVQLAPGLSALLSFSNKQRLPCHLNGWSLKTGLIVLDMYIALLAKDEKNNFRTLSLPFDIHVI